MSSETSVNLHCTPRRCFAGDIGLEDEEIPDQQKKLVRKTKTLLMETEGSAGARLWVLPGPGVGVQLPLPMNDRGRLAYPADRSSIEEGFISLSKLDGHGSVIFYSSRVEPRASVRLRSSEVRGC
jgi:hypothetical protein